MTNSNSAIYEERLLRFREEQKKLKQSISLFGWVRLGVFALITYIIIAIIVPYESPILFMGSIFIGVMVFMVPLAHHQKLQNQLAFVNALILINENELSKKENLFTSGSEFKMHSALALDIDLVGEGSLFALINRCVTRQGNTELVNTLIAHPPDREFILKRQASVKELTSLVDFRQEAIAIAFSGGISTPGRNAFTPTSYYINKRYWQIVFLIFPIFSFSALVLGFYINPLFFFVPLMGGTVVGLQQKTIKVLYREINGGSEQWKSYSRLFEHFHKKSFQSEELKALTHTTQGAHLALQQLGKLVTRWDQRSNFFASAFMNALMLFDIKCAYDFEKWKSIHNQELATWINAIGKIECLNAQATFAFNHPHYTYPTLKSGSLEINMEKIGHPLIDTGAAVTNSIQLGKEGRVYLITGSNMSGKSTFLRAIGMNVVLAQSGLPVFADSMEFTPLHILTSFRQSDSVQENTSYFMAELKRLKEIIEAADHSEGSLVLLDEILRGTNSEDKSHGSEVLLEKLISKNAITILATHDLKLGELESKHPGRVMNYCFESSIHGDELTFDYKIKRGVAQNKNATFLMKKMGIV